MAKQGARGRTRRRRRLRLWEAQGGRCFWCGRSMALTHPYAENFATFEHLFPHGHADRIEPWAIVLACRACNERRARASVPWEVFWPWCQAEIARQTAAAPHAETVDGEGVSLWTLIRS